MSQNETAQLLEEKDDVERCQHCQKIADFNIQKLWVKWAYYPETGGYSRKCKVLYCIEPELHENLHLCKECTKLWEKGEI